MSAPAGRLSCRIAAGEVASHAVHAGDRIYAFMDIRPIRPGHLQIVPRAHHRYVDDLPPDLAAEIVHLGQRLAPALKRLFGVDRAGFLFTGNDVAHAHAHAVPLHTGQDVTARRHRPPTRSSPRRRPASGRRSGREAGAAPPPRNPPAAATPERTAAGDGDRRAKPGRPRGRGALEEV